MTKGVQGDMVAGRMEPVRGGQRQVGAPDTQPLARYRVDVKYFAYGSNLSSEELRGWCPGAEFVAVARLPNHRLDFTRYSAKRQGGVADVVPARGEMVWGVLYDVPSGEMAALDRKEGVAAKAYERKRVTVTTTPGPRVRAVTYSVIEKKPGQTPSEYYLGLILTGAREWALPEEYVRLLEGMRGRGASF